MDENEIMEETLTEETFTDDFPPHPEDDTDWDKKRREEEEKRLAPYKAAAAQRKENAAVIAEHDQLLADMLFEMTMNELGE